MFSIRPTGVYCHQIFALNTDISIHENESSTKARCPLAYQKHTPLGDDYYGMAYPSFIYVSQNRFSDRKHNYGMSLPVRSLVVNHVNLE